MTHQPKQKSKHQKVIEGVDKFFEGLDTIIKGLIRGVLNLAGVVIDWAATVFVGSIGYLGKQGTITIVNGAAFIFSIGGAVWQFGRAIEFIFKVAHGLSGGIAAGKLQILFWIAIVVGGFLNYNQIQSRFWKFKDTVASQFRHLGNPGEGDIEPLTPQIVAEQRFSLAFRRRERTTQLFYNVETGIYILFILALLFAGASVTGMGLGAIVLEIFLSMLALKLPELLLGLAEDNTAIWVSETQSNVVNMPTFNRSEGMNPGDMDKTAPLPQVSQPTAQPQSAPRTIETKATPAAETPNKPPATPVAATTSAPPQTGSKDVAAPKPKPKPIPKSASSKSGKSVTQF